MNEHTFQLFPCEYKVPCQTHQCFGRGAFYIGRPNQKHTGTLQILCEKCADELVQNILDSKHEVPTPTIDPEQPLDVIMIDGVPVTNMTVKELKEICKDLGCAGYSAMNKEELIRLIDEVTAQ